jgi:hypothetical protein
VCGVGVGVGGIRSVGENQINGKNDQFNGKNTLLNGKSYHWENSKTNRLESLSTKQNSGKSHAWKSSGKSNGWKPKATENQRKIKSMEKNQVSGAGSCQENQTGEYHSMEKIKSLESHVNGKSNRWEILSAARKIKSLPKTALFNFRNLWKIGQKFDEWVCVCV